MEDKKELKEFLAFIIKEAESKGKDPNQYAKELGEDGMKEAYKRFKASKQKQAQKAAKGAKLQYINKLNNRCADDEELVFYRKGGAVDCGCKKKKMEDGSKVEKAGVGTILTEIKNKVQDRLAETKKKDFNKKWDKKLVIIGKDSKKGDENSGPKAKVKDEQALDDNKGIGKNKCGSKIKKHQGGSVIERFKVDRLKKKF